MSIPRTSTEVGRSFAANPVIAAGQGAPVVFLHGVLGQEWPGFLDDLAVNRRVFAPATPGISDPADLQHLDTFADLVLYYDDLFDQLGLEQSDLVGHSFGGMVAAEYAATMRGRVRSLVLIDAMGLWLDETPVEDHLLVAPERQTELLFADTTADEVRAILEPPDDIAAAREHMLDRFDALGASSHFIHPIPERGLIRRASRISAPTLLVWGASDQLVPPVYAQAFADVISGARVELIEGAGHHPHLERRKEVGHVVGNFLDHQSDERIDNAR